MKTMIAVVLSVLGTGCGWYPFPYKTGDYTAKSGCIEVHSDFEINQVALDYNVAETRRILDEHGIISKADFCNEFQDVPIAVSENETIRDGKDIGYYSRLRGILLGYKSDALLHEFIHEVDVTRDLNYFGAGSHQGWKAKGYWDDSLEYKNMSLDLKAGNLNGFYVPHDDGNGD